MFYVSLVKGHTCCDFWCYWNMFSRSVWKELYFHFIDTKIMTYRSCTVTLSDLNRPLTLIITFDINDISNHATVVLTYDHHLANNVDEKKSHRFTLSRDQRRNHRRLGADSKQPHNNAPKTSLNTEAMLWQTPTTVFYNSSPEDPWLCTVLYIFLIWFCMALHWNPSVA